MCKCRPRFLSFPFFQGRHKRPLNSHSPHADEESVNVTAFPLCQFLFFGERKRGGEFGESNQVPEAEKQRKSLHGKKGKRRRALDCARDLTKREEEESGRRENEKVILIRVLAACCEPRSRSHSVS